MKMKTQRLSAVHFMPTARLICPLAAVFQSLSSVSISLAPAGWCCHLSSVCGEKTNCWPLSGQDNLFNSFWSDWLSPGGATSGRQSTGSAESKRRRHTQPLNEQIHQFRSSSSSKLYSSRSSLASLASLCCRRRRRRPHSQATTG